LVIAGNLASVGSTTLGESQIETLANSWTETLMIARFQDCVLLAFVSLAMVSPASAQAIPFSLNLSGSAVFVSTGPGTFDDLYPDASGTISPFGSAQALFEPPFTLSSVTFALANGNTISATLALTSTEHGNFLVANFNGTITGGTGTFANASGSFQMVLTSNLGAATATSLPFTVTGSGTINVVNGFTVVPTTLQLQAYSESSAAVSSSAILSNQASAATSFTAAATVNSGKDWLSVSPAKGSVLASSQFPLTVTANPSGLTPGIYQGQVNVEAGAGLAGLTVTFIVGTKAGLLQLSETGEFFQTALGGPQPSAQIIQVQNTGVGNLTGLAATTSVKGSVPNWLRATIAPGFASQTATQVTLTVDPTLLDAGTYYGQVNFSLPNALNSPQSVIVQMQVSTGPLPTIMPSGYLYQICAQLSGSVPTACGAEPGIPPQIFYITNPGLATLDYTVTANPGESFNLGPWLVFSPASGTVAPGQTATLTVSISSNPLDTASLETVNRAGLDVYFPQIDFTSRVTILVGIKEAPIPGISAGARPASAHGPAVSCSPTLLRGVFTSIPLGFQASVGQPTPLEAQILDDCANPLESGTVVSTFSSGDAEVALSPQGSGRWTATWTPTNAAASVAVALQTSSLSGLLGNVTQLGSVATITSTPIVNAGGVSNAASSTPVIAPGAFISIYGVNIGGAATLASSTPLPDTLGLTQAFLAGQSLPLQFSGSHQVNAVVPYDIAPNSSQQLIVQAGNALSQPEPVTVATAAPGVFTQDQSGKGPGAILVQPAGSSNSATNTPANPARAGDALLIFCTGLGAVNSSVPAGSVAPSSPPAKTTNLVTVTVGGIDTPTLFAGLAPGFVGLYQVNVLVPSGLAASTTVPVVLTVAGAISPPVTIAVK
jgi:uncharacterized protein (TIGR03437 family)